MGGLGSGGRRQGAGRPQKDAIARSLDGNANHRGRVLAHPNAAAPPAATVPVVVEEFDAPDDLNIDERRVWMELAPHAFQNGTLTKATSLGFRLLCRNVVLERRYAGSVTDAGGANHRGMIQRVDAELLRFNLAPCGKPVSAGAAAPEVVDPMEDKYFGRR